MIGNSQDDQVDNVMRKFSETNPILLFRFQKPSPRNGFPPTLYDRPYYKRQWVSALLLPLVPLWYFFSIYFGDFSPFCTRLIPPDVSGYRSESHFPGHLLTCDARTLSHAHAVPGGDSVVLFVFF